MTIMTPKEKAEKLISDFLQMQPNGLEKLEIELSKQYEFAKLQAQYVCHAVKWSHDEGSEKYTFWNDVKKEIGRL